MYEKLQRLGVNYREYGNILIIGAVWLMRMHCFIGCFMGRKMNRTIKYILIGIVIVLWLSFVNAHNRSGGSGGDCYTGTCPIPPITAPR